MKMITYTIYMITIISSLCFSQNIIRLKNAHSHNDYEQAYPLYEALNSGFTSIEADIYLNDDELYVSHEKNNIKKENTLKSLYLDPLQTISKGSLNKYYHLFPIILLVDIKSDGLSTYKCLDKQLAKYEWMVSKFNDNIKEQKFVDIIISGNRPKEYIQSQKVRYASIDGRIEDIKKDSVLYPLISTSVTELVNEDMPIDSIKILLADFADKVKKNNKISRLWGVPDKEQYWKLQLESGLDLIGTDDPNGLKEFFKRQGELD